MSKYQKQVSIGGAWLKASEVKNGTKAKLISETTAQPSNFLDKQGQPKTQDVAKVRVQGIAEPYNVNINRASINALVDAFGEDSKDWINKVLTLETEKVLVAGKRVVALYFIPEGYTKTDDDNGYVVIVKKDQALPIQTTPAPVDDGFDTPAPIETDGIEIDSEDVPF